MVRRNGPDSAEGQEPEAISRYSQRFAFFFGDAVVVNNEFIFGYMRGNTGVGDRRFFIAKDRGIHFDFHDEGTAPKDSGKLVHLTGEFGFMTTRPRNRPQIAEALGYVVRVTEAITFEREVGLVLDLKSPRRIRFEMLRNVQNLSQIEGILSLIASNKN